MTPNDNINAVTGIISDMFARNDRIIGAAGSATTTRRTRQINNQLKLALAVVLVELASCDEHFDSAEYSIVCGQLEKIFGCSSNEFTMLIKEAKNILGNFRGTSSFTQFLSENLSPTELEQVGDAIESVIAADSREDGFETYFRHRLFSALGITRAPKAAKKEEDQQTEE